MRGEMSVLEANQTWKLVLLPLSKKHVDCKWVYVVKMNLDGSVSLLKARLVAKGSTQTYGMDSILFLML